jgi:hypothetical protein
LLYLRSSGASLMLYILRKSKPNPLAPAIVVTIRNLALTVGWAYW